MVGVPASATARTIFFVTGLLTHNYLCSLYGSQHRRSPNRSTHLSFLASYTGIHYVWVKNRRTKHESVSFKVARENITSGIEITLKENTPPVEDSILQTRYWRITKCTAELPWGHRRVSEICQSSPQQLCYNSGYYLMYQLLPLFILVCFFLRSAWLVARVPPWVLPRTIW